MTAQTDNTPFYSWVPRPLGILILLLMFVPPTFSGGAYLCNVGEMSGALGMWSEDIQMAAFFTSIGMCLFPPFMVRFLQVRNIRKTYVWCFAALALLNWCCAVTTSLPLLLVACLLIGFVRIVVMLNCTFTIAPYLTGMNTLSMFTMTEEPSPQVQYSLERKRTVLMPVLYFYILLISQLSNMLMAWFAYHYNWQDAYYVVIAMLLMCMILAVCTMKDSPSCGKYHFQWDMLPDMLLMATALCGMTYALVYGKTLDWFASARVKVAVGITMCALAAIIWRMRKVKKQYYLPAEAFKYRNVLMAILLFLVTMIFNSANAFVGAYAHISTAINNMHGAFLSQWAIVGCAGGLILSLLLIRLKVRFRTIFVVAFLIMAGANACLYFQYQTVDLFSNMVLPMVLNFMGLLMLYSIVAAFGMKKLPSHLLATFVFIMIWVRNAIAPVIGTSIYSNWLNNRQQYHITRLMQNVDASNPIASAQYAQVKRVAKLSGKGEVEAEQMATFVVKGRVAVQATIVAMKEISGQTVLLLLGASLGVLFLPYHKKETT